MDYKPRIQCIGHILAYPFPGPPAFEVTDGAIAKAFSAIIHHKGHASAAGTWLVVNPMP